MHLLLALRGYNAYSEDAVNKRAGKAGRAENESFENHFEFGTGVLAGTLKNRVHRHSEIRAPITSLQSLTAQTLPVSSRWYNVAHSANLEFLNLAI